MLVSDSSENFLNVESEIKSCKGDSVLSLHNPHFVILSAREISILGFYIFPKLPINVLFFRLLDCIARLCKLNIFLLCCPLFCLVCKLSRGFRQ